MSVRRVTIQAGRLRASVAGVDVPSATGEQLLFDSAALRLHGVLLSGVALSSSFSESSTLVADASASSGFATKITRTTTISYGKTFSTIPAVMIGVQDNVHGGLIFGRYTLDNTGASRGFSAGNSITVDYVPGLSSLTITIVSYIYSGTPIYRTLNVSYLVLQN